MIELDLNSSGKGRFGTLICAALRSSTLLFIFGIGGCATPHPVPPPTTANDYKDRHPIVLSEAPFVLDVFPKSVSGKLDHTTAERLSEFTKKYAEFGQGPVSVAVPVGASHSNNAEATEKAAVLRGLSNGGMRDVRVVEYPVADPKLAAPIRLTFVGMKAKVSDRCGLWPRDLASGTSIDGWQNQTYWNFGCATQNMIATQTADPADLVSPRGETPADIQMRMRAIGKLRGGTDPATSWSGKAGSISGVGG